MLKVFKMYYLRNRLIKKQMRRRRRRTNMKEPSLRSQYSRRPLNILMHCNVLWRASQKCLNK
jgi:hypothetical protein